MPRQAGVESCPRRLRRAGSVTDFVPTRLPGRPLGGPVATGGLQVELDALCQPQRVGVVDRVGLAPPVGAPRVRTRLAAAAGFLLAADRAADHGAGGAAVDVGVAPARPGRRPDRPGRLEVGGAAPTT